MAKAKGTGLFMVWADVPADKEHDFNRWYNEEHLAELMAVPGVLNAARYEAVQNGPKHLACYELESSAVVETDAFKRIRREFRQHNERRHHMVSLALSLLSSTQPPFPRQPPNPLRPYPNCTAVGMFFLRWNPTA